MVQALHKNLYDAGNRSDGWRGIDDVSDIKLFALSTKAVLELCPNSAQTTHDFGRPFAEDAT